MYAWNVFLPSGFFYCFIYIYIYSLTHTPSHCPSQLATVLGELNWGASPPVIVSLQNGVENAKIIRKHCPNCCVLAAVVVFNIVRYVNSVLAIIFIFPLRHPGISHTSNPANGRCCCTFFVVVVVVVVVGVWVHFFFFVW